MNDASRVLVAMRVRGPAELAFVAFTERIAEWWQPNGIFQFTPDQVGTMVFDSGPSGRLLERYDDGTEFVIGQVRVWEPPRRVVLGWRHATFAADQDTELHVSFEEVTGDGVQTRVTVEHFGWDRIPPQSAARHGFPLEVLQLRFAEWWQAELRHLPLSVSDPIRAVARSRDGLRDDRDHQANHRRVKPDGVPRRFRLRRGD